MSDGAGKEPRNQVLTAALLGGAVGAAAGATAGMWSARAIARRNGAEGGREINAVLKTAATACELSHAAANGAKPEPTDASESGQRGPST